MQINVLEYLENSAKKFPDKLAYSNEEEGLTFSEVLNKSKSIGTFLASKEFYNCPVVVFMKKHPNMIPAFFGSIYAGNYYVPIDDEMPQHRIEMIFSTLKPKVIICDRYTEKAVKLFDFDGDTYLFDDISETQIEENMLQSIRKKQIDTDPIYIFYTSGSTGVPKGVVACHRSVIDYIEHLSEILKCDEDTVFGNQTPLYFDASLKEVYSTIKCGATTYFIPKQLFMFPIGLVEFLNKFKINTLCWVVSAFVMISRFNTFETIKPKYLHTIAFGSEVFPIKQFNKWKEALPNARYLNLYGPTEITGICCYYEVDREFSPDETIPIGFPCKNTGILLINEKNEIAAQGEQGEICVRGTGVTLGYYKNTERTNEVFVQNPVNNLYSDIIYRTGDLGRYNEKGELVFLSRKDFQIKHMGHRIELGEIEVIASMHPEISAACCIFDNHNKKIVMYYVGTPTVKEITLYIKDKLPRYMVPNVIKQLETMPLTPSGKTNRNLLKEQYLQNK